MGKIFITGTFLLATYGSLLAVKRIWRFRRSCSDILIPFEQFKARELENIVERALIRHKHHGEEHPLGFEELGADRKVAAAGVCGNVDSGCRLTLDEAMCQHIEAALRSTGGRIQGKDGAAAILDVHPNTLRSRMRKLGVSYGRKSG